MLWYPVFLLVARLMNRCVIYTGDHFSRLPMVMRIFATFVQVAKQGECHHTGQVFHIAQDAVDIYTAILSVLTHS